MPYVVTRKRRQGDPGVVLPETLSRRAVATLEEAKGEVWARQAEHDPNVEFALVPESGGTVGPLPDGSIITVERVEHALDDQGLPMKPVIWFLPKPEGWTVYMPPTAEQTSYYYRAAGFGDACRHAREAR